MRPGLHLLMLNLKVEVAQEPVSEEGLVGIARGHQLHMQEEMDKSNTCQH